MFREDRIFARGLIALLVKGFFIEMQSKRVFSVLLLLLLMMGPGLLRGQDPMFSQFFAAPIYLNPAFAGSANCFRISINYRQLRSIENFHSTHFSLDAPADWLNGGLALLVLSDQPDMYMLRNSIGAAYAYHLRLSHSSFLHFGIQAQYLRNDLRWDSFSFYYDEPPPEHKWRHSVDFATGLLFYRDIFYAGVAAHHVNRPNMALQAVEQARLDIKYTAHLGASLGSGLHQGHGRSSRRPYTISPNLIVQNHAYHTHVSLGIYAGLESIIAGFWYRHWLESPLENNDALVFLLGLHLNNFRIGYSYDHSLSGFSDITHGVHELSLAFDFFCRLRNIRTEILKCPSF